VKFSVRALRKLLAGAAIGIKHIVARSFACTLFPAHLAKVNRHDSRGSPMRI
jgi:hypothetical protein